MPAFNPPPSPLFDPSVLDRLACPVCFGELRLSAGGAIECSGCRRSYPVVDGIPVLIAERATVSQDSESEIPITERRALS